MVKGAVGALFAALLLRARLDLVVPGVVLQLLPAVAVLAGKLVLAPVAVVDDVVVGLPVRAGNRVIEIDVRLSPVVLPVMRVDAEGLIVLRQIEGAPNGFEVEHVEVIVVLEVVDQLDDDIVFAVREAAVSAIVAVLDVVRVVGAELSLVLIRLVELLHSVMRFLALIAVRAGHLLLDVLAEIRGVKGPGSLPVLVRVIVGAVLVVVRLSELAGLGLEKLQVQVLNGELLLEGVQILCQNARVRDVSRLANFGQLIRLRKVRLILVVTLVTVRRAVRDRLRAELIELKLELRKEGVLRLAVVSLLVLSVHPLRTRL